MTTAIEEGLDEFARDTVQDVLATAEATDTTAPDAFTQRMVEHLTEAGELDDGFVCYHRARGLEVHGYSTDEVTGRLDLFVTHFAGEPGIRRMTPTDVETRFRRLREFLNRCGSGYSSAIEDASPVFDMVLDIEQALKVSSKIRLLLFTNSVSRIRSIPDVDADGLNISFQVWDLERLRRLLTSGTLHEPIIVDFVERFGEPLPCLTTPETDQDYAVLLTILPGGVLDQLYGEYGPRLLELNVRSCLQARGAVNKGIRRTLLESPERFLAYNNGISATASRVDLAQGPNGQQGIRRLHDLQIVNGGQTTASIHVAAQRDRCDLSGVYVEAKVTVVSPERIGTIVPQISKFSNTQNKVTTADFYSNDAYHVAIEKLSRSIWAPSATGDAQDTRWFYERARGQYADELARQRTPARQRAWKVAHPARQKFTKVDIARYENSWDLLPHIVSRGAEKNFREYMLRLDAEGRPTVDEAYFQRLIGKAILFRATQRLVSAQQFGGYRANIVTYTIARLCLATSRRIDLESIWQAQGLSLALEESITELCRAVQPVLTAPPRQANIGEWCKRPDAWAAVEALAWDVPATLDAELLSRSNRRVQVADRFISDLQASAIVDASAVTPSTWHQVAGWAKETSSLQPWQRSLAFSLGRLATRDAQPSPKQAVQGMRLLDEATRLGFRPDVER